MKTILSTINNLTSLIADPNCANMNKSTLKGYLGELIIKKEIEDEGVFVQHHGNQSGYDLSLSYCEKDYRIDVKTSLPKDEFRWNISYWGWALLHENKKKEIKATHLICLACDADCRPDFFVVVPVARIALFPRGPKQFSKVKHALFVTKNQNEDGIELLRECAMIMRKEGITIFPFETSRILDRL